MLAALNGAVAHANFAGDLDDAANTEPIARNR
jgi:hypothetical protein